MALQQYHIGGTYYGYDPQSGQIVAFSSMQQLQQYFPNGIDKNAPTLPANAPVQMANQTPGKIVNPFNAAPTSAPAAPANTPAPVQTPTPVQNNPPQGLQMPSGYPASSPTATPVQPPAQTPTQNPPQGLQMPSGYPASNPTPTTTPTATPTPTVTSDLPSQYRTGNPQMDAILGQFYDLIQKNIAAGKVVNPNMTIDAATVQQFIDQAHKEIDPYYATQLGAIKDDLIANLKSTSDQYQATAKQEALAFKQNVTNSQESSAGAGLAFSGVRGQQEQQMTQAEQNTLDLDQLRAASSAAAAGRAAEQQAGTSNLAGINFPQLPSYQALIDPTGGGVSSSGSGASYFTPGTGSAGNVMGTLPAQQQTDISNRVSGLKSDYLTNRTYSSLTTT